MATTISLKFTFLFSVIVIIASAQNKNIDSASANIKIRSGLPYITFNGGAGIPAGRFGMSSSSYNSGTINYPSITRINTGNDVPRGYALLGTVINISAGFPISHSCFGFAGQVGHNANQIDISSFISSLNASPFNTTGGRNGHTISYEGSVNGVYKEYSFLAGWLFTIQNKDKSLQFDLDVLGGIVLCNTPEVSYLSYIGNAINVWYSEDYKQASAHAFGFDIGANIKYSITKKISALIHLDFMYTQPIFNIVLYYDATSYINTVYCPIGIFNLACGIGYQLGNRF